MPAHAYLLRQLYIVRRLQQARGRALPFAEIRRYLLEETSVGDFGDYLQRTFERDKRLIPEIFGVTIKVRKNQGYYINADDTEATGHEHLLEAVELHDFLQLPQALAGFVQPEARWAQGLEHLRPLLQAAQARRVVEFDYRKHWEENAGRRTVGLLLLKEFRGRWYVLGQMEWDEPHLACFGLDRISNLQLTNDTFDPPAGFDAATYYANAFGITRPHDAEPQEVVLRFTAQQGRYVLGCPLHASQRVLTQDASEIQLALTVFDTHELHMELLSYGPGVEALAPASLRTWLQTQHNLAASPSPNPAA